jgi:hypothetical protein
MEVCLTCRWLATTAFDETRHIAPSLRLFIPNDLTEYYRPFLLNASASDIHPWLDSHGDCSPAAPSLRSLISSGSFIMCEPFQCINLVFFY